MFLGALTASTPHSVKSGSLRCPFGKFGLSLAVERILFFFIKYVNGNFGKNTKSTTFVAFFQRQRAISAGYSYSSKETHIS
jgi:hypothetical protein